MNNFKSWTQSSRWYEQLRVVDNINDSGLCAQGYKSYEQLKAMNDMNDIGSWA